MQRIDKWWQQCSAVKRYMPEEEQLSISDILAELDTVVLDGYDAIHITAPYKSAGAYPWWGLRPLDYFALNQTLGSSIDEFKHLVDACHQRGLYVMIFLNLGYADVESKLWMDACFYKKHNISHPTANYFLWSDSKDTSLTIPGNAHFKQGGHWIYSPNADAFYWCNWEEGFIWEPQYNWASPDWQIYAQKILNFWLDTDVDGIIVDAVNWYLNCNFDLIKRCVTDVIHNRPGIFCIPEGATGFYDEALPWLRDAGFDIIEDQPFHSDWEGSAILDAIHTGSASQLASRLQAGEFVRANGSCLWSYLHYSKFAEDWTPQRRLLEIALLLGTGHMVDCIGTYLQYFTEEERISLRSLLQNAKKAGISPASSIQYLQTTQDSCFACLNNGTYGPVLCLYNVSDQPVQVHVTELGETVFQLSGYECQFHNLNDST